jgi:DUF4097 and DUF4098 domain-containing protein YvlB
MKRLMWLAPALAAAALAQTNLTRDGNYWVETITGSAAVEPALQVRTLGSVRVQGEARPGIAYTLKRRARVADQAAARRLLDRMVVRTYSKAGVTVFEVTVADSQRTSADLQLQVPRTLRETAVATQAGAVQMAGLAGSARADTGGGAVDVGDIDGAVYVRTGGGAVRLGRIGGKLECYSSGGAILADSLGADSGLNTGGGEIVVRQAKGMLLAKSSGGGIRIEHALKGVKIASGGGLVDILESSGPVIVETGAGSIKVRSATNVQCESGAGTIHLQAVSGELRAATGAGSIVANLSGARALRDSRLSTSMGDITVFIPSNLSMTVDAISTAPGGHRIVSDFPEFRVSTEQGAGQSAAHGSLNGGGPVLRLAATGGTIYLRREK